MTPLAPVAFGRSVVTGPGTEPPQPWADAPQVSISPSLLEDSAALATTVERLHRAWVAREPVVVRLGIDAAELRRPESSTLDPWRLRRGFSFNVERLHFLIWANSYDIRNGELIW